VTTPAGVSHIQGANVETLANPDLWTILDAIRADGAPQLGDIWTAAEAAGVRPGTLRTWMTRGKLQPVMGEPGQELFHIPTVVAVAEAGRKFRPADPAANSRGPHLRRAA
jgi:hypothetical protein